MRKFVLAAGVYPPDIGGPATFALMLGNELPNAELSLTVVPFHTVRHLPKVVRHVAYAWRLWRATAGMAGIVALDPISVGVPSYVVSRLRRIPLVVRLGGDFAWEQGQQRFGITETLDEYTAARSSAAWQVRVLHAFQAFVCRHATKVVLPSQYLKSIVATWGIPSERLQVIYTALHPLQPTVTRAEARAAVGASGFTIVTAPRLVPWKGVSGLIEAFVRVQKKIGDATLLIAGDGTERKRLEEQARTSGLGDHIHFFGALPLKELANVLLAADAFVLNTSYEGLSHQLLEVMELGLPIVTTPVGGNVELVTDGASGLFVPFNDVNALTESLLRLEGDPALRERLVKHSKQTIKSFTSERSVGDWRSLLMSL